MRRPERAAPHEEIHTMMKRMFASLTLASATVAMLGSGAMAGGADPGSLLVYPCYDNRGGTLSILSVVNTHDSGTVAVEFVYINGDNCLEFNRSVVLTAKDTFSAVTGVHNPAADEGYVYAFAKSPTTGQAISWDHLVGAMAVHTGTQGNSYEVLPYIFKSGFRNRGLGMPTDADGDGLRDLDGIEYEQAPDRIIIPQFIGNGNVAAHNVNGTLAVLGLTGIRHTTIINFAIYNDNEEMFSSQLTFDCWDKVRLRDITNAFSDSFLKGSNQNPLETQGLVEDVGWYEMDGLVSFSTVHQVSNPAFLAMQIQESGALRGRAAARAFMKDRNPNGALLSTSIFGDPDPAP
jgi:hypothetical protein